MIASPDVDARSPYPARLAIDWAERQSRWKAALRILLSLPLLLLTYLLLYLIFIPVVFSWILVLARGRIPRWLFDFEVSISEFYLRANAYTLLLTDEYAPFDSPAAVRYEVDYPSRVSRLRLVIWKLLTAIPHLIALQVLYFAYLAVTVVAWFAIVFSGSYPRGLHDFATGVVRWGARVWAYVLSLTDEFPPYSLDADAGPAGRSSYLVSSGVGVFLGAGAVALIVLAIVFTESEPVEAAVSYERLADGTAGPEEGLVVVDSATVALVAAVDPADDLYGFLAVEPGERLVEFRLTVRNTRSNSNDNQDDLVIRAKKFTIQDAADEKHAALVATVDARRVAPAFIHRGEFATVSAVFEMPAGVEPAELAYEVTGGFDFPGFEGEKIVWRFR